MGSWQAICTDIVEMISSAVFENGSVWYDSSTSNVFLFALYEMYFATVF